ncbi:DUF5063 domain-containing protein [Imhoffiella purpurea]|uniref:DUF5063 domain-containing protein n=1 Tax=Imhoffiella purpurea TaxID=1249627 RepID=W9V2X2_9GAMM|nr:DUF5063 domain-containing protein [Imhoffiella purpurea]EXJ13813.1 hypothetical protein D779_3256 [Imhoffiella purpurea]
MTQSAQVLDFSAHREHRDVAALARRYCDLIDTSSDDLDAWLREVADLLPRLHAAIASCCVGDVYWERPDPVDLDARFDLFARLRRLLADRDSYWLEFDCVQEGAEAMTGSLADDLTDIYCELKQGLGLFDRDPEHAIAAWSAGYDRHWGRHLIDAERHLASLGA